MKIIKYNIYHKKTGLSIDFDTKEKRSKSLKIMKKLYPKENFILRKKIMKKVKK